VNSAGMPPVCRKTTVSFAGIWPSRMWRIMPAMAFDV
jgi:hypothetical protein